MATAAKQASQDMPPPGGFGRLQWERIKLKTVFGPKLTVALFATSTVVGIFAYKAAKYDYLREQVELRSARHAILPMLIAERDRAFLKQVRKNRDEEKELMKNVPEWEVGTYFREPVYITMPKKFHEPTYYEFMAHADFWDTTYRIVRRHFL